MAIKRKIEDETPNETKLRTELTAIANHATRGEKTSWARKRDNLSKYVESDIRPLEIQIEALKLQLLPMYDHVTAMRNEMITTCIHPFEELRKLEDGSTQCTFCNAKLVVQTV